MKSVGQARLDRVLLEQWCAQFPLEEFGLHNGPVRASQDVPPPGLSSKQTGSKARSVVSLILPGAGEILAGLGHIEAQKAVAGRSGAAEALQKPKDKGTFLSN